MDQLMVPAGVSNRHLHLSQIDLEKLFGEGAELTVYKWLGQPGQYAADERVTIVGPKGKIEGLRVLGPVRKQTQIEVSLTDAYSLGLKPPVRESGELGGTEPITLIGPKGTLELKEGCILAARHIHMTPAEADQYGIKDRQMVKVEVPGPRGVIFNEVIVRVRADYALEFHVDTDEANAALVKNGQMLKVIL
jgi:putative phosphotransacetylase